MNELLLTDDQKELNDLRAAVESGNRLVCRIANQSPDYRTNSWVYFFHITATDGKVYYWPETFKDYQASRVFNDIKAEFGDVVSIDFSRNAALKPFFDKQHSNVVSVSFGAQQMC